MKTSLRLEEASLRLSSSCTRVCAASTASIIRGSSRSSPSTRIGIHMLVGKRTSSSPVVSSTGMRGPPGSRLPSRTASHESSFPRRTVARPTAREGERRPSYRCDGVFGFSIGMRSVAYSKSMSTVCRSGGMSTSAAASPCTNIFGVGGSAGPASRQGPALRDSSTAPSAVSGLASEPDCEGLDVQPDS